MHWAEDNLPSPDAILNQLDRILQSTIFKASGKQKNFLKFVLHETLEHRASQVIGYTIAVDVYGRTENFNPSVDPIVGVEAGRLRRALYHYYLTTGENDPIRIDIPKGSYVPKFCLSRQQKPVNESSASGGRDNERPLSAQSRLASSTTCVAATDWNLISR